MGTGGGVLSEAVQPVVTGGSVGEPAPEPAFVPDTELFPFRSRWFQSSAGRVHYIDEGEGQPILFLHGNPTWSFVWRGLVLALRERFRCVAPDYLGFGLSEHPPGFSYIAQAQANVVLELVRHLGLEGLTVVGHDWGGPIGMELALDEKPRVRALVMGNTWYWPLEGWRVRNFARVMASDRIQRRIRERNLYVERVLPRAALRPIPRPVMRHYREVLPTPESREGVAVLVRQIRDAEFWLGQLSYAVPRLLRDVPLLLTWGVRDRLLGPRLLERFGADFNRAEVVRLDSGHLIQEDAGEEMAEAIDRFLSPVPV